MNTSKGHNKTTCIPWILYGLALTFAILYNQGDFHHAFFKFLVFFSIGLQGLWAAIGHLLFSAQSAKGIGWKPSQFQTEVGFTNLALGITGVFSIFYYTWIVPISVVQIIFYSGCVYGHIRDRLINKNNAPCNSGPMLYSSTLLVLSLIYLLLVN